MLHLDASLRRPARRCRFTVDVPTTADVKTAYAASVGSVYFAIPLMKRDDLEAAGWVANIGVNPQQGSASRLTDRQGHRATGGAGCANAFIQDGSSCNR